MSFLFLVPLTVTLGSGCVFKAAKDTSTETATVAFAIGLISLAFTLILSPWEVQLLLVVLLIANVRWAALLNFLFSRSEDISTVSSTGSTVSEAKDGSAATASTAAVPTLDNAETTPAEKVVLGKYRGAVCELSRPAESSPRQLTGKLQYRGAKVR